jgi:hypothetical protein
MADGFQIDGSGPAAVRGVGNLLSDDAHRGAGLNNALPFSLFAWGEVWVPSNTNRVSDLR